MDKTIGLEIIGLAYMLIFTFISTVGSIGGLKKMLSEKFDNSGDDDFEENSYIRLLIFFRNEHRLYYWLHYHDD